MAANVGNVVVRAKKISQARRFFDEKDNRVIAGVRVIFFMNGSVMQIGETTFDDKNL